MRETAYGIDLAGYSSKGKSQVSRIEKANDGCLYASFITTDLLEERKSSSRLSEAVEADVRVFSELIKSGGLCAVDVPIDLQGLNHFSISDKKYVWEATKRPIDYVLGGLPPLGDKIGAVVARIQLIMEHFPGSLGNSIFETYPSGTLALLGFWKPKYKGGLAQWTSSGWRPAKDTGESKGLAYLLSHFDIVSSDDILLTDDQLDALLSALPLLEQPLLTGSRLMDHPLIMKKGALKSFPQGFILCGKRFWSRIVI